MKRNFLVVAADESIREVLARNLRARGYMVTRATNAVEAERTAGSVSLDGALIESHLPDLSAEELKRRIQRVRPGCRTVVVTGFEHLRNSPELFRHGADDYLMRSEELFDLVGSPFAPDPMVEGFARRGNEALISVIDVLVGLLELDDNFFGGSSHKAAVLVREVAEELGAEPETIQEVILATLLRDVGKVGVESDIFAQEGALDETQKKRMREHVSASLRLFEHVDFPWKVMPIIRHHHERYDGTGYPDGLRGREIPMGARIVSVVDAYVALTSDRYHRDAVDPELALQRMIRSAGRQFDPEVIEAFQKVLDKRLVVRSPKRKREILVVDPQEEFRKVLKMRLINESIEVREAQTVDAALKMLNGHPADLVVSDVDDEGNDAFRMFEGVRKDRGPSRTPIVFMARGDDRVMKIRALREGVDDYLLKQDDLDEIVVRLQNILTREAARGGDKAHPQRRGITGELENLSLPDIIQTLVMGMKSARVTVSSDDRQGTIWFDRGAAVHSETDGLSGEEAFYEMVRWSTGEFVIEHGITSDGNTLSRDTMFLLMEGMRLIDEKSDDADAADAAASKKDEERKPAKAAS